MLSQSKSIKKESSTYPMLAEPKTIRLLFKKTGAIIFTSHLDLQRTMMRVLARADLPLWFTKGFNPHAKLVFGLPLPLGCSSECELMDIKLERDMPCLEILERMQNAEVPGLSFTECYPAEVKFADISAAEYTITVKLPDDAPTAENVNAFLNLQTINAMKKTKSGVSMVNIAPLIRMAKAEIEENIMTVKSCLAAGSNENLSPELVMDVLLEKFGDSLRCPFRNSEKRIEDYSIIRTSVLNTKGKKFK